MGMRHHTLFYAFRFNRPYGTIVCFFPVSQEFLLGYSQTVPTGLTCPLHDPMGGYQRAPFQLFENPGLTCPSHDPM